MEDKVLKVILRHRINRTYNIISFKNKNFEYCVYSVVFKVFITYYNSDENTLQKASNALINGERLLK